MTIRKRIILGFLVVVFSILLALYFSVKSGLGHIQRSTRAVSDHSIPSFLMITQIRALAQENYGNTFRYVLEVSPHEKAEIEKKINQNIQKITGLFKDFEAALISEKEKNLFQSVLPRRKTYVGHFKQVLELSKQGNDVEAYALASEKMLPAYELFMESIQDCVNDAEQVSIKSTQEILEVNKRIQYYLLIGMIVAACCASLMGFLIAQSINRRLQTLANQLNEGALQVSAAADQLAGLSRMLANDASEQAALVEETSSAVEEIKSMALQNGSQAALVRDEAKSARETVSQGVEEMKEMTVAMDEMKTANVSIAKVIKTIDEIAFQTNILALNAAVEAARAGEAGAGFGVVADEVRNLAHRSAVASRETADMIQNSISRSQRGTEISSHVAVRLQEIEVKNKSVDTMVTGIAAATQEQTSGVTQITQSVARIDKGIQANAARSEEAFAASEELTNQAHELNFAVENLLQLVNGKQQPTSGRSLTSSAVLVEKSSYR